METYESYSKKLKQVKSLPKGYDVTCGNYLKVDPDRICASIFGTSKRRKVMKKENNIRYDILHTAGMTIPGKFLIMKEETKIPVEVIDKIMVGQEVMIVDRLISSNPRWTLQPYFTMPKNKEKYVHKYIHSDGKEEYVHWNRIHGKHRKIVKFECKKEKKKIRDGILTFNHFAGREDVMCIRVDTSHSENGKGFLYQIKSLPYFLTMNPSYRNEAFSSSIYDIYLKVDSEVAQAYLKHQEMTDNAEKVQS